MPWLIHNRNDFGGGRGGDGSGSELMPVWNLNNSPRIHSFTGTRHCVLRFLENTSHRGSQCPWQSVDSRQHVCEIDFLGVPWTFKYFYKLGYSPTLSTNTFFLLPSGKALAALLKFLIWLSHHLSVLNTWKRQWDCDLCLTQEQNNPTHQAHISVTSLVGSHTDLILLQASASVWQWWGLVWGWWWMETSLQRNDRFESKMVYSATLCRVHCTSKPI